MSESNVDTQEWIPRTKLGKLVKEGKVASIKDILEYNMPIREYQIVDLLIPSLESKIIYSDIVQRQTDAGEVNSYRVVTIVGNRSGFVGVGTGKARQLNDARQKSLIDAKLNITYVKRGCGSWECRCGTQHSLPNMVRGKSGSVELIVLPAPRGTGVVASDIVREVFSFAGISDAWVKSFGETRNRVNMAYAALDSLRKALKFKSPIDWNR
ncbi:30S ribosomal protein S5 [Candidatus Marsarchaeota G2 archaeon ECH_B_SAG-F08]|jgi:small subunit ribosomal protein S5|uniref:Small ribosomal subunit protein uS5 n=4 Tax=Candidatus Marsarchaeota TaxID=1978152 RepID=A0A2R6AKB4_9ARCH|nr:MAG: 30S ribosomal protein S5 [Candidatus Marsarchaeota G1 archaeon BE_D]PSN88904.1 MAG: 30S ribosomal protein S5 [Candidatus Marsarchaeota G1 archaeon OSP_C]PSN94227.1 MAG: 30S ribosomal protein S5 [Candidatus Marsarchaeota G1 archaeon OSP_B]PSN97523.1 MAG: 30S ribosomal protein S5 [Candidatus Marsarchaeota G2 archaeon ECH_B_SAG-F08]